jgi:hypothetical protein
VEWITILHYHHKKFKKSLVEAAMAEAPLKVEAHVEKVIYEI